MLCDRAGAPPADSFGPAVKNLLALYNITASSLSASGPHSRLIKRQVLSVHWHSQDFVLRGPENLGAEFETGIGRGYPPPHPTRGSGGAS